MVSSVDGRVSVKGKSGAIGSDTDRQTMRELRSKADAVMAGSGTLRAEKVSLTSEGRRTPEPIAVIVSGSLNLPLRENLKDSRKDRTLILTTESSAQGNQEKLRELEDMATLVPCRENENGEIDLSDALGKLRRDHGIESLLSEGGPGLNHRLISAGLADELFLTLSPQILSGLPGSSLNITSGDLLENPVKTRLISVYTSTSERLTELFLRYEIEKNGK